MSTPILVIGATGKQGGAAINALLAHNKEFQVVGLTRNTTSVKAKALTEKGVTCLEADLGNYDSLVTSLKLSKAKRAILITDFWGAGSAKVETQQGINFLKAVEEVDPSMFVVYSSVGDAGSDTTSKVTHFRSKAKVEDYLKSSQIKNWAILRPVAFFENLDDAANWNPLKKGSVKMLTKPETKLKYVSSVDIGKGLAALVMDSKKYKGKTIEFAMGEYTGTELAESLSEASGVPCKFSTALPRLILYLFMWDMWHMVKFFEDTGFSASIEESKKLVPDGMDAKAWFESKGVAKWKDE